MHFREQMRVSLYREHLRISFRFFFFIPSQTGWNNEVNWGGGGCYLETKGGGHMDKGMEGRGVPGLKIHHGGDFILHHCNLLIRGGLALPEAEERHLLRRVGFGFEERRGLGCFQGG